MSYWDHKETCNIHRFLWYSETSPTEEKGAKGGWQDMEAPCGHNHSCVRSLTLPAQVLHYFHCAQLSHKVGRQCQACLEHENQSSGCVALQYSI
eukprot:243323-Pelagomonas_calceolata.AAC.5